MFKREQRGQAGQSIIIVAFLFLAMVLLAAVAVDISSAYVRRRDAQNAADAAALAGVQELGRIINLDKVNKDHNDTTVRAIMVEYARRNGIEDPEANTTGYYLDQSDQPITDHVIGEWPKKEPPEEALGVQATIDVVAPSFFGGVAGRDSYALNALAQSHFELACEATDCLIPIAIQATGFTPPGEPGYDPYDMLLEGQCYNIWDGPGAANMGWLNWSNQDLPCSEVPGGTSSDCSAQCLDALMDPKTCEEHSVHVEVDDYVGAVPGVMDSSYLRDSLLYYIGAPPDYDDYTPVKQIIFDTAEYIGQANQCGTVGPDGEPSGRFYHVVGFASFRITGYYLPKGNGQVEEYCVGGDGNHPNCYDLPCDPSLPEEDYRSCVDAEGVDQTPYVCNPYKAIDYPSPELCGEGGDACLYETGDYARITGMVIPWTTAQGGENCEAVGNLMVPRITK